MQHVDGLMDKRQAEIGKFLVAETGQQFGVGSFKLPAGRITAHGGVARMPLVPLREATHTQIVLVVKA